MSTRTPRSVADDLRGRSVRELQELILRRPDLVRPMPADLTELAAKATQPASIRVAIDNLNPAQLSTLQQLCGDHGGQSLVEAALAGEVDLELVQQLWAIGLLWGVAPTEQHRALYVAGPVRAILTDSYGGLFAAEDAAATFEAATASAATPTPELAATIAQHGSESANAAADPGATGGDASNHAQLAMQAVVQADDLIQWFQQCRPRLRKSGGMGVRELGSFAQQNDLEPIEASFWAELLAHAGFLGVAKAEGWGSEFEILATPAFDAWSALDATEQWLQLMRAWASFTSDPQAIGTESTEGERINALSGKSKQPAIASIRLFVLRSLAQCEPGSTLAGAWLRDAVDSRFPKLTQADRQQILQRVLLEGTALGALRQTRQRTPEAAGAARAYVALTMTGRVWVESVIPDETLSIGEPVAAADQLAAIFPHPVDQLIAQADMTLVVPGQPSGELRRVLGAVAQRESTGGATVYRLSPATLRQAMARGWNPAEVLSELSAKSITPIPQPMAYLINDAAKSPAAEADSEVEPELESAPEPAVRAERGLDGYGSIVGNGGGGFGVQLSAIEAEHLAQVLARTNGAKAEQRPGFGAASASEQEPDQQSGIASWDRRQPQQIPPSAPKATAELLAQAAGTGAPVAISQVDGAGVTSQLVVEVVSIQPGSVTVLDLSELKIKELRRSQIAGAVALTERGTND